MQTKFKRHQVVTILRAPMSEYIEFYGDEQEIKPGMKGKVNLILSNGQYHVEILDQKGETLAYAPFNEEDLEAELPTTP